VIAQLLNLKVQPAVARAVSQGRLGVYGWYYDILDGHIEQYDEAAKSFAPLIG
jgi:carbonic anhydrase